MSTPRLHVLRATYALIAVGLALVIGPLIIDPPQDLEHMRGVVWSLLTAVALLAALGIRYPLQMLPLLLFELVWKSVWVLAIGLPRWSAGTLTAAERQTWYECVGSIVLLLLVIPWRYVVANYVTRAADRWSGRAPARVTDESAVGA